VLSLDMHAGPLRGAYRGIPRQGRLTVTKDVAEWGKKHACMARHGHQCGTARDAPAGTACGDDDPAIALLAMSEAQRFDQHRMPVHQSKIQVAAIVREIYTVDAPWHAM
jgi:hypothetical protein